MAKTLYATNRARPDTWTVIVFLTAKAWLPDEDDWVKLVHLMRYIRGACKLSLTLRSNRSVILKWHMDALFVVHPNMRVHSGGGLSLGSVFPIIISTEQKPNKKIPRRHKLWALTTSCQPSTGLDISLQQKDTPLSIIVCTRTTRFPFFWIRMGRP